jgi:hypothetical protein
MDPVDNLAAPSDLPVVRAIWLSTGGLLGPPQAAAAAIATTDVAGDHFGVTLSVWRFCSSCRPLQGRASCAGR